MLAKIQKQISKRKDLEKNLAKSETKLAELKKEELQLYREDGDGDDSIFSRKFKGLDAQIHKENDLVEKYRKAIQGRNQVISEMIEQYKNETHQRMQDGANSLVLQHKQEYAKYLEHLKIEKEKGRVVDNLKIKSQLSLQASVGFLRQWNAEKLLNLFENNDYRELDLPTAIGLGVEKEFTEYRKNLSTTIEKETRKAKEIKRIEQAQTKELRQICVAWDVRKWIPAEMQVTSGVNTDVLYRWFQASGNHPSDYVVKSDNPIKKKKTKEAVA